MDERAKKLKTPEDCLKLEANALARGETKLARDCRLRALELQAEEYGAESAVEKECLQAVYAYERILTDKNGRKTRAIRTWQMIKRHGILQAVERAVNRPTETMGYTALLERGLQDYAFEAVILRHPKLFSAEAVERSKERVKDWQG